MSTYDENVRSYESFARGSLEASPGTGSVEELPLTREEPETPPRTPPPKQKTTPNTPGFAETAPTLGVAPLQRIKRRAGAHPTRRGHGFFGRGLGGCGISLSRGGQPVEGSSFRDARAHGGRWAV